MKTACRPRRIAGPRNSTMPVLASPYRSFSLWPATTSSNESHSSSTAQDATPASFSATDPNETPSAPTKPSLLDLTQPSSLPDPTLFEPLSAAFLSLPPTLSLSYAAFIPLFTILYRSCTTLPVTFWQRARIRRFRDVATPVLKRELGKVALETRAECRRAGKSFEEYQAEYKKRAKKLTHRVARRFNCSPRLTMFLPPLAHIPLLVTFSLVLRDACARAESVLAVAPSNFGSLLSASPTSALTEGALAHLHELASTPLWWCPSLILPDPTMLLPLGVGLTALLNVEVNQRTRRLTAEAAAGEAGPAPVAVPAGSDATTPPSSSPSIAERRRLAARRVRGERSLVTQASSPSAHTVPTQPARHLATEARREEVEVTARKPNSQRIVTNVLRLASVVFIPVAGMAPSAVCLYWLTSNLYTLSQNLGFWWRDRAREKQRRMRDILSGRAVGV
ncbi:hypothetical protein JCM10908_004821 [Rhodotorula pacifica]|uniref:membrane insertase COX18 n=1 Tax=Rhodotorula pacifica TaxID=1495444 RepID=UPI00317575CC